jgi:hypothetical protein
MMDFSITEHFCVIQCPESLLECFAIKAIYELMMHTNAKFEEDRIGQSMSLLPKK